MGWTECQRMWPTLHTGFAEKGEAGITVRCRKAEMGEKKISGYSKGENQPSFLKRGMAYMERDERSCQSTEKKNLK